MIDGKSVKDTNKDDILGNGAFSYNPATKTLSVKKNYTATDDGVLIWSKIEGLTVRVCADVTLTTTFENRRVCFFSASTTFTGWGELTMRSKSGTVYTTGDLIFDNIRANIVSSEGFALLGNSSGSKLIIRNSTLSISGIDRAVTNFGGGITLEQCEVVSPEGAYVSYGTFLTADNTNYVKDLFIQAIQPDTWPLKIDGTAVTNSNCSDILDDGRFRFDTATKTLWVQGDYTSTSNNPIIDNEGVSNLLICNDKPITLTATNAAVFKCAAPTVFSNCDFTMTAPSRIAQCGADVIFDHAAISLTGGTYGLFAVNGTERLSVNMSDISISAKTAAVFGFEGGVALERSRIVLPEEGVVQDGSFCDKDGNVAKNLEIKAEYLSIRQQEHCQVTATPSYPQPGETVTLTATLLDNHYFLQSFKVTDSDGNAVPLTGGTWDAPTATFVMPEGEVTVEPVVTDDASTLYVCVPKTGSRTIQIDPHWNLTGLKIHDDGGPKADYSANSDGTLTIMAPEGYVLQLTGIVAMDGEYEGVWEDYITIHDGATTAAPYMGKEHYGYWNGEELPLFESTGRAITIHQVSNNDISVKSGFTLTLTMVRRELLVGGILVTDENKNDILGNGLFSFDPGSYTLHVKGCYSTNVPVVQNLGYDQLTISVDQDATLTTTSFTDALLLLSPTTITGPGLLTLQSDDVACESFADLTFDHASVAVKGNGFALTGDPNGTTKLIVKDSYLHLDMEAAIAVKDFYGGIELEGCELLLPEEGYISGGTIWFKDGNDNPMEVIIGQQIQLSVAGTAVTMQNCSDVLGNGLFSYNPGTKTLTVKGSYSTGDDWMITNGMEGVTINVPADATLEVTDEGTGVLGCYAATTFTGKGRLTMKAPAGAEEVIYVGNDVTLGLDHADIVVKGAKVGLNTLGDMSTAALDIVHSNLQAEGTQAAAGHFGGGISLTECELFFPSPGDYTNSRFLDKNGNDAKAVIVTYDIATGITERPASSSTKEPAYYDLSGRRIQRPQKGMYIVRDHGDRSKVLLMR